MRSYDTPKILVGLAQRAAALQVCRLCDLKLSSPVRLRLAARAGLTILLTSWLTLALFLAPYWAAQTNFPGHQHADSVLPHIHTIQAVTGLALVLAAVVAVLLALCPAWPLVQWPVLWLERFAPRKAHGSRAPPLPF